MDSPNQEGGNSLDDEKPSKIGLETYAQDDITSTFRHL